MSEYNDYLLALLISREARGEPYDARAGVLRVVHNRCVTKNQTVPQIILKPFAFSSFNKSLDENSHYFPRTQSEVNDFMDCFTLAQAGDGFDSDITKGATHYHSYPDGDPRIPSWAQPENFTVKLGHFSFYTNIVF